MGIVRSPYSQLNQDLWVLDFFKHKRSGVFVDIGAYDGIDSSNTFLLESEYDWNGICIEANGSSFEKLKRNRRCICVHEMLSDEIGKVELLQHLEMLSYGEQNLLNIDIEKFKTKYKTLDTTIEYHKTNTLQNVLNINKIPAVIDYLSIDVEGMEYDILKDFDFEMYHVNALTIEHNAAHIGIEYRNKLFELLTKKGFLFVKGNDNVQNWDENKYYIEDFYVNNVQR
jgi:FkbM family methyltransferase